jgi:hypothetical protein
MPEVGGEGVEQLADYFAQLSERQAANARILLQEIERHRNEAREQGRNFAAPTRDQILDRLQSAHSPFFIGVGWGFPTPSPGTFYLETDIFNPDPVDQDALFVHVFIGPAGLVADAGQALALVDARFPRLTEPGWPGLALNPSGSAQLEFHIEIPAGIEPSNYLVNAFLFQTPLFYHGSSGSPPLDHLMVPFGVT